MNLKMIHNPGNEFIQGKGLCKAMRLESAATITDVFPKEKVAICQWSIYRNQVLKNTSNFLYHQANNSLQDV